MSFSLSTRMIYPLGLCCLIYKSLESDKVSTSHYSSSLFLLWSLQVDKLVLYIVCCVVISLSLLLCDYVSFDLCDLCLYVLSFNYSCTSFRIYSHTCTLISSRTFVYGTLSIYPSFSISKKVSY
jgi:hypothetical protein